MYRRVNDALEHDYGLGAGVARRREASRRGTGTPTQRRSESPARKLASYLHSNVLKVALGAIVAGLVGVLLGQFVPGRTTLAVSPSPSTRAPTIPGRDYNGLRVDVPPGFGTTLVIPGVQGSSDGPVGSSCSSEEYHTWAGKRGGVAAHAIEKFIGVEALDSEVVAIVLGINVRVLSRRPPVAGLFAACPTGDRITYTATVDLDQPSPTISFGNAEEKGGPRDRLHLAMHQGDVLDIHFTATATQQTVSFAADLVVLINDKRTLIPIATESEPITVSPAPRSLSYTWDGTGWREYP